MSWHISNALMRAYENSHSSQGQAAESSAENSLDGVPSALSKSNHTPLAYLCSDRMTAFSTRSLSGMTFAPLMADLGEAVLTWFLEGFPAKPTAPRLAAKSRQKIFGRKCGESWQMSLPNTSLPRTPKEERSTKRQMTLNRWVTKPEQLPLPRLTWVLTTFGNGTGYLHTPTVTANYAAKSMQKHECCRIFVAVFGRPTPLNHEWLMGWPPNWTALEPLEMDKYQSWLHSHGGL